jgi:Flp pilus assembly protein TadB
VVVVVGVREVLGAVCGGGVAAGLLVALPALTEGASRTARRLAEEARRLSVPVAVGLVAGAVVGVVTGWPVAGLATVVVAVLAPEVARDLRSPRRAIDRVEGVAAWTETLRDTIAGRAGLLEAMVATRRAAPPSLAREVEELARWIEASPREAERALMAFADAVADPLADLVVHDLLAALRGRASRVNDRLSALAQVAREEARLRRQVEAERAELRSSAKWAIVGSAAMIGYFALFSRSFLEPFGSPVGQVVLAVVVGLLATGGVWLVKLFRAAPPPRLFPPKVMSS